MIFNTVENFHGKSVFSSGCKKFWVVQIFFKFFTELSKINVKKNAKSISFFYVSTLCTTIQH